MCRQAQLLLLCVLALASCSNEGSGFAPPVGDAGPPIDTGPSAEQREATLLIIQRNYQ